MPISSALEPGMAMLAMMPDRLSCWELQALGYQAMLEGRCAVCWLFQAAA